MFRKYLSYDFMPGKLLITKFYYYDVKGFGENLHNELVFQDIQIKELAARTGIKTRWELRKIDEDQFFEVPYIFHFFVLY